MFFFQTIYSISEIKQDGRLGDDEYVVGTANEADETEINVSTRQRMHQPVKRKRRRIVTQSNLIMQRFVIGQQKKLKMQEQALKISQQNSDSLASVADSIRILSNSFKSFVDFVSDLFYLNLSAIFANFYIFFADDTT